MLPPHIACAVLVDDAMTPFLKRPITFCSKSHRHSRHLHGFIAHSIPRLKHECRRYFSDLFYKSGISSVSARKFSSGSFYLSEKGFNKLAICHLFFVQLSAR